MGRGEERIMFVCLLLVARPATGLSCPHSLIADGSFESNALLALRAPSHLSTSIPAGIAPVYFFQKGSQT